MGLTRNEYWPLFDHLTGEEGEVSQKSAVEILKPRNRTTAQRAHKVALHLIEMCPEHWADVPVEEIMAAPYASTEHFVRNMFDEYVSWRLSRRAKAPVPARESSDPIRRASSADLIGKLKGICSQIWVPGPDDVPSINLFQIGSNAHEEEIKGKILRWRHGTDGSGGKGLVWLDVDANQFLTQEFFDSLNGNVRTEIESVWEELQIRIISYIEKSREYKFRQEAGFGYTWSVSQIAQADISGNALNENHPMVEDARHLIKEARWLNAEVERFKTLVSDSTSALLKQEGSL